MILLIDETIQLIIISPIIFKNIFKNIYLTKFLFFRCVWLLIINY